jgi:hypothetical protein
MIEVSYSLDMVVAMDAANKAGIGLSAMTDLISEKGDEGFISYIKEKHPIQWSEAHNKWYGLQDWVLNMGDS